MSGKFILYIPAAAVAVTGLTAAPGRRPATSPGRLAALAGIAIIGATIHESRKDKRRATRHRNVGSIYRPLRPHRSAKRHYRCKAIAQRAPGRSIAMPARHG